MTLGPTWKRKLTSQLLTANPPQDKGLSSIDPTEPGARQRILWYCKKYELRSNGDTLVLGGDWMTNYETPVLYRILMENIVDVVDRLATRNSEVTGQLWHIMFGDVMPTELLDAIARRRTTRQITPAAEVAEEMRTMIHDTAMRLSMP